MPIVFTTTPPQPASNARRMFESDSVGGADASRKGFSKSMPVNVVESVVFTAASEAHDDTPEASSTLKGVRQLGKKLPVDGHQSVHPSQQLAIVAVTDEHDRLPIQLVGKEDRAREIPRTGIHDGAVELRVARRRDVLRDAAHEHPRGERVGALEA